MSRKCQTCEEEARFCCRCINNVQLFCENCGLNHLKELKVMHNIEAIIGNHFCEECKNTKKNWFCVCKGIKTYLCNNCLMVHINKNAYASHSFSRCEENI